ncbi:hypothetical protein [Flammeovirga agarivorans]|uniref:LTD domain-containing protein n=1 Tax=Flammeovirga agarivorans TaxID=2726742 RepID=A0A7X8XZ12_9BACT|nr:hypothetical protein [Flammeovirga agarivorans]NLR94726.1 hypothetical protein [Flammeovirga agarivorans]
MKTLLKSYLFLMLLLPFTAYSQATNYFSVFFTDQLEQKLKSSGKTPTGGYQFIGDSIASLKTDGGTGQRDVQLFHKEEWLYNSPDTLVWNLQVQQNFVVSSSLQKTNLTNWWIIEDELCIHLGSNLRVEHFGERIVSTNFPWKYGELWNDVRLVSYGNEWFLKINGTDVLQFSLSVTEGPHRTGFSSLFTSSARGKHFSYKKSSLVRHEKVKDTFPPTILILQAKSQNELDILFDEDVVRDCIEPTSIFFNSEELEVNHHAEHIITVQLPSGLTYNEKYLIEVENLCDTEGNYLLYDRMTYTHKDEVPPHLESVKIESPFSVSFTLSEPSKYELVSIKDEEQSLFENFSSTQDFIISDTIYINDVFPENEELHLTLYNNVDTLGNSVDSLEMYFEYDTQLPKVTSFGFLSDSSLEVIFSEEIEEYSLLHRFNYSIQEEQPLEVVMIDLKTIHLIYPTSYFKDLYEYTLVVQNIKDKAGNLMKKRSLKMLFDLTLPSLKKVWTHNDTLHLSFSEKIIKMDSIKVCGRLIENTQIECSKTRLSILNPLGCNQYVEVFGLEDENKNVNHYQKIDIASESFEYSYTNFDLIVEDSKVINPDKLYVYFNKILDKDSNIEFENRSIRHWVVDENSILIQFEENLIENDEYTLDIKGLKTCEGDFLSNGTIRFTLDQTPPTLLSAEVSSMNSLTLYYSESIEESRNEIKSRFLLKGNIVDKVEVVDQKIVIHFSNPLNYNETSLLEIAEGISDFNHNLSEAVAIAIQFPKAITEHDIVFNEFMIDPFPSIGGPEAEFIEIFNSSKDTLNLVGLRLKVNEDTIPLPNYYLPPSEFAVLIDVDDLRKFTFNNKRRIIEIDGLPTLTNSNFECQLIDYSHIVIDDFTFSDQLFPSSNDGGVTLERIDPLFNCDPLVNWNYSDNSAGHSLCEQNSIFGTLQDFEDPIIEKVKVINSYEMDVYFSEALLLESLKNTMDYSLSNVDNSVNKSYFVDNYRLKLIFEKELPSGMLIYLTVDNFVDCFNNLQNSYRKGFVIPKLITSQQLLITELMIDHSPKRQMPDSEYVEVHNQSKYYLSLDRCRMLVNGDTIHLPDNWIIPSEYQVLCPVDNLQEFEDLGISAIGVEGWRSLPNEEGDISIVNQKGEIIDRVKYHKSFYQSTRKNEGGWSLELIDINSLCKSEDNWSASIDDRGGTAGEQNSISQSLIDINAPTIAQAFSFRDSVIVQFTENIDWDISLNYSVEVNGRSINNNDIHILDQKSLGFQCLFLTDENEVVLEGIKDCFTNTEIISSTIHRLNEHPENDLYLSEILFNPSPLKNDFVEIHNTSAQYIDLKEYKLANLRDGEVHDFKRISTDHLVIPPFSYFVFTEDVDNFLNFYPSVDKELLFELKLPSFPNDEGGVAILNETDSLIDAFSYHERMHQHYLENVEDVSLERSSFDKKHDSSKYWVSATESSGFATPTERNSREGNGNDSFNDFGGLVINKTLITPNGDGIDDFLEVQNTTQDAVYILRLELFDMSGKLVKSIVNNYELSYGDQLKWDGSRDDGQRFYGQFILMLQSENQQGDIESFTKTISVATWF